MNQHLDGPVIPLEWNYLIMPGEFRSGCVPIGTDWDPTSCRTALVIQYFDADWRGPPYVPTDNKVRDLLAQQGVTCILYNLPKLHFRRTALARVVAVLRGNVADAARAPSRPAQRPTAGILADESWTLSQSYYFGSVNCNPARHVEVIDSSPIDQHDDLDTIWLGKPGASEAAAETDLYVWRETREDSD